MQSCCLNLNVSVQTASQNQSSENYNIGQTSCLAVSYTEAGYNAKEASRLSPEDDSVGGLQIRTWREDEPVGGLQIRLPTEADLELANRVAPGDSRETEPTYT